MIHRAIAPILEAESCYWWESMAWVQREYSKGEIDRAGQALVNLPVGNPDRDRAIEIVDNWRSSHAYPLQVVKMTLLRRAKRIDPDALIAQRLKRRPSIEIKLRDNENMKLSQMQDLGGCRAILHKVSHVKKLVAEYKKADAKSPKDRSRWDGSDDSDYILRPKPDGYRGVHLIFRFQSPSEELKCFNGQRIEIQIRSLLQHLWATAVETAQVFTGQALKSKVKNASDDWLRFFALTSSIFAIREKCPPVPGTPGDRAELVKELSNLLQRLNVMDSLWAWNSAIHLRDEKPNLPLVPHTYLLRLDSKSGNLNVTAYSKDELSDAQAKYEALEKETEDDPNSWVVLVAVENLDALRKAYPNYYLDTQAFTLAVEQELLEP